MAQGFGKIRGKKQQKSSRKRHGSDREKNYRTESKKKSTKNLFKSAHQYQSGGGNLGFREQCQDESETQLNQASHLYSLGISYLQDNQLDLALECLQKVIKIKPDCAEIANCLGTIYQALGRLQQSQVYLKRAINLNPNFATAYYNLAGTYVRSARIELAISCYQKALALHSNLNSNIDTLKLKTEQNLLLAVHYSKQFSPEQIFRQHQQWGKQYESSIKPIAIKKSNLSIEREKIKIGYISNDFKQHPISYFLTSLLTEYDRDYFKVICYSNSSKSDIITAKIQSLVDRWQDISSLTNKEAAELICRDRIDILVDLGGHTANNRLLIFAYKPAPIQVSYLGYPNTTGLSRIDYKVIDNYTDLPLKTGHLYTEKLVRLPHSFLCYQPSFNSAIVPVIPLKRNQYITFGSFNNIAKVSPETIGYWAQILQQVPQSKLLLKYKALEEPGTGVLISQLFQQAGISQDRLILKGWVKDTQDHLAVYNEIDIALDTYPYHGTTTTCEALYMGVPVITLAGEVHVSRVGVSLLSNVGLTEFIANSSEDYINKAITLANNPEKLSQLRQNLRSQMEASPLMNAKQITQDIESAYRQMWQKWCDRSENSFPEITIKQAIKYLERKQPIPAREILEKIIHQQPENVSAWQLLGNIYHQQNQTDLAVSAYQKVILQDPECLNVLNNLSILYLKQDKKDLVLANFQRIIAIKPDYAEGHSNLGQVYQDLGQPEQAIVYFQKAISLKPSFATAYYNLGNAYKSLERFSLAISNYLQALKYNPLHLDTYNNLANTYLNIGNFKAATDRYQQALEIASKKYVSTDKSVLNSEHNLLFSLNYSSQNQPVKIHKKHRDWGRKYESLIETIYKLESLDINNLHKIKIAYISHDFKQHSVSYFLTQLLSNYDRNLFHVTCYTTNSKIDRITTKIKSLVDAWRDITSLNDEQAAKLINQDKINILVDLSGHTANNRLLIFAYKPAPIQVTYLGYPNTTGLSRMDYRLTDNYADPLGKTEKFYTETLVRLPQSFLAYQPLLNSQINLVIPVRRNGYLTFGSFNNLAKISEEVISYWGQILQQVPQSKIFLKYKGLEDPAASDRIKQLFSKQGILADRLILKGWVKDTQDHLAVYNEIDIALDTYPYHGTTTTCEALYMGVPVITLAGEVHVSRVGVSLLSNVGLTEFIANNPEEYISKAITLANNQEKLSQLRKNLRSQMQSSPLMNGKQITQDMESAYRQMWQKWCDRSKNSSPEITTQKAIKYLEQKQPIPARKILEQIIQQQPENVSAWQLLGSACYQQQKFSQAISNYQQALKIEPNNALVLENLGVTYIAYGDLEAALKYWQQVLKLQPNRDRVWQNILFCLHYSGKYSPESIYQQHLAWGKRQQHLAPKTGFYHHSLQPQRKLKIGYVSGDLKHHPVAYFLIPILANCDRNKHEIFCYANNTKKDDFSQKIQQLANGWRDISRLQDIEVVNLIKQDKIDILVDLSGHNGDNRLLVFARKPAPLQVTYLGYADTTGLNTIDYRLTDNIADPQGTTEHFNTEELVRLSNGFLCYQPHTKTPTVNPSPIKKNGYITFGSFNNIAKISEEIVKYWANILQQVPQSKLFLKYRALNNLEVCDRIKQLLQQQGIKQERLILKGWVKDTQDHLATYNEIDIALDTYPYHGTTTTCEALYMGVPVITLAGEVHVSRVGVSLLSSVGLTEFIANNPEEYINKAIKLANNPEKLSRLRQKLRSQMEASPLMNGKQITQDLESAYRQMWEQWCQQKLAEKEKLNLLSDDEYFYLGNLYQKSNNFDLARENYQKAIQINPHKSFYHYNLGNGYFHQNRLTEAISYYQKAIELDPNYASAYNNIAKAYKDRGDLAKAIPNYQQALKLKPQNQRYNHNFLHALNCTTDYSPIEIYREHLKWGQQNQKPHNKFDKKDRDSDHKLRIGYISGDLYNHSISYFLEPLLANYNKESFTIFCYYNNVLVDEVTSKLKELADVWHNISSLEDAELIQLIRQDKIDILVDLSGHTKNNRLLTFAAKPAPIQVTYLGYPNTTGLSTIDYRLTDIYADILGVGDRLYTEKLIYLPHSFLCYQPHNNVPSVAPLPAIKNKFITFGSFNNLTKLSPETIKYWTTILQRIPDSRLIIKYQALADSGTCDRIFNLFAEGGISKDRLELLSWLPEKNSHLAVYNKIDIALDTFPYHGTTTTCEALYMGVPVITLAGEVHVSRVGVSLLSNVGLTEFIANNPEKYIDKTIALANNSKKLSQLRKNLRSQMEASPLMDAKQITQDIESAYRQMWLDFCAAKVKENRSNKSELIQNIRAAFNLYHQGNLEKSQESLEQIINNLTEKNNNQYHKETCDCWHLLGNIYRQQNKLDLAINAYQELLQLKPQASLMSNLGVLYIQHKQIDKAIAIFEKAIALEPQSLEAYNNLGELYREQKQYPKAAQILQQAIKIDPDSFFSHYHLGLVYRDLKDYSDAVKALQKALEYQPNHENAHLSLCLVLDKQGKIKQAEESYHRAIELVPQSARIYFNLGNFYKDRGQLTPALTAYLAATQLKPDYKFAYNNLGCLYRDLGRIEESLAALRQAIKIDPDFTSAYQNLLYHLQYSDRYSPVEIAREHLHWGKKLAATVPNVQKHNNQANPDKKLRIGYLSGDLRTHSVAYFLEPILANYNSQEFTIYCYSNNPLDDATTDRFKQLVDTWHDLQELDNEAIADLIQADSIDILVDLAGHTGGNKINVLAKQPAPIQMSYLGYPNTIGLDAIHYRFTDASSDPVGETENLHAEELIRLPNTFLCYQPPADTPEVNSLPANKNKYITFGSFNHIAKISETTINCWIEILQAVPHSRLILKYKSLQNKENRDRFYKLFTDAGIDCDRLDFRGWTASIRDHFALYHKIDLALDTYPYNGTTTTCEALWMGVPVITLAGESHVSRVGVSLLSSVGLTELINYNSADYIQKAIELAKDREKLSQLRQNIRCQISSSPLMNGKQFTQDLENSYRQVWQQWCQKQNNHKLSDPKAKSNLNMTQPIKQTQPSTKERFTILTIHHLAATGGTLISKCLAAMPNVVLLSEIHPGIRVAGFNPFDPIQQFTSYGLLSPEELRNIFQERITLIAEKCRQNNKHLIIRDHSHSDFLLTNPVKQGSLLSCLSDRFDFKPLITLRNPIDSWLSMLPHGWHRHVETFDNYCDRYLKFINTYQNYPYFFYENFVVNPDTILDKMCQYYGVNYDSNYRHRFARIRLSGDSGRTSTEIAPRPRRKYDLTFVDAVNNSPKFAEISHRLGYQGIDKLVSIGSKKLK